jgi:hypothetical protein
VSLTLSEARERAAGGGGGFGCWGLFDPHVDLDRLLTRRENSFLRLLVRIIRIWGLRMRMLPRMRVRPRRDGSDLCLRFNDLPPTLTWTMTFPLLGPLLRIRTWASSLNPTHRLRSKVTGHTRRVNGRDTLNLNEMHEKKHEGT